MNLQQRLVKVGNRIRQQRRPLSDRQNRARRRFLVERLEDRKLLAVDFGFALAIGSTGTDEGRAIARDVNDNVYVTGRFEGTVDFDPGPGVVNLTSSGGSDISVAKHTPAGGLAWANRMGGVSLDRSHFVY